MKYKCAVTKELMSYLESEPGMISFLGKKGVDPEGYALFVYTDEVLSSVHAGHVITLILMLLIGGIGYAGGGGGNGSIVFGFAGAVLGLLIGVLAVRNLQGKQSKYVDYPDIDRPGNYLRLGIMNKMSGAYMRKITPAKWEKIKKFSPDLSKKMYQKFVGDSKTEDSKAELMKLTPARERLAAKFRKMVRFSWWAVLPGLLFPFFEGDFFLWWGWLFIGMALMFMGFQGLAERKFGFFEINNVDLYGWPATISALVCVMIALMIFIFPGVLGVFDAFNIDLMTLIFS